MLNQPLVSIITPSYNQVEFLEATIRSVLGQDYPHIEYIIMDGESTDGSLAIIEKYANQLAYWISEPDRGQADAINKGLQKATGEILAWINSDDLYMAGAVEDAVRTLDAHPEAGMVYADGLMVDARGKLLDPHHYRTYSLLDLLCFEVLLQPTVFLRRSIYEHVGSLDDQYHLILDHEYWIRIAQQAPIMHVPSFWAAERTHLGAKTISQASVFVDEAERMIRQAEQSPSLGALIRENHRKVYASLNAFAARRYIDAGQHGKAVSRMIRTLRLDPLVFARYWYKFLQASISALGLDRIFFGYRRIRRRIQHGHAYVMIAEHGAELVTESEDERSQEDNT